MTVQELSLADQVIYQATHLVKVSYTDLVGTAALTKTQELLSCQAGQMVRSVWAKTKTAFAGGAISALGVEVGDDGDVDRNLASYSVFALGFKSIQPTTTSPSVFASANGLDALFTAVTANLSALTAGEVWFYIFVVDLNRPEGPRD